MFASVFAREAGRTPKLLDFPEALLPDHQNVELARTGQMFNDRFRVQLTDQVATTITSHNCKEDHYLIHTEPAQCPTRTVREVEIGRRASGERWCPDEYFSV